MKMRRICFTPVVAVLIVGGRLGRVDNRRSGNRPRARECAEAPLPLPNATRSLKFVLLGDSGTGPPAHYDLAAQMARFHDGFKDVASGGARAEATAAGTA